MSEPLILCPHCGKHTRDAEACDFCNGPLTAAWREEQAQRLRDPHPQIMYGPPPAGTWMNVADEELPTPSLAPRRRKIVDARKRELIIMLAVIVAIVVVAMMFFDR